MKGEEYKMVVIQDNIEDIRQLNKVLAAQYKNLQEKHISNFAEKTKDMNSVEILNYYRNLYHAEPDTTEQGIVARAINDILPTYVNKQEIRAKAIDEFARRLKLESYNGYATLEDYFEDTIESVALDDVYKIAEQMKAGGIDE